MTKKKSSIATDALVPVELIERRIYLVRGHKVMLDSELAELYQVSTKVFNQAVSRNRNRFPEDFMFQLTVEEDKSLAAVGEDIGPTFSRNKVSQCFPAYLIVNARSMSTLPSCARSFGCVR